MRTAIERDAAPIGPVNRISDTDNANEATHESDARSVAAVAAITKPFTGSARK
jgi:hypothetical protein